MPCWPGQPGVACGTSLGLSFPICVNDLETVIIDTVLLISLHLPPPPKSVALALSTRTLATEAGRRQEWAMVEKPSFGVQALRRGATTFNSAALCPHA